MSVRATLPLIEEGSEAAQIFAAALSRISPELLQLWGDDLTERSEMLISTVTNSIAWLGTPVLRPFLSEYARVQRSNGLRAENYFALHIALMDMLSHYVGHDNLVYDAWDDTITVILSEMLNATHGYNAAFRRIPLAA